MTTEISDFNLSVLGQLLSIPIGEPHRLIDYKRAIQLLISLMTLSFLGLSVSRDRPAKEKKPKIIDLIINYFKHQVDPKIVLSDSILVSNTEPYNRYFQTLSDYRLPWEKDFQIAISGINNNNFKTLRLRADYNETFTGFLENIWAKAPHKYDLENKDLCIESIKSLKVKKSKLVPFFNNLQVWCTHNVFVLAAICVAVTGCMFRTSKLD